MRLLTAFALLLTSFITVPAYADERTYVIQPSVDLSAIRFLVCMTADGEMYSGSGFLIGPHQMVTAFHVAEGSWQKMPRTPPKCMDVATKTEVITYKTDRMHDIALMTGPGLPTDIPYLTYICSKPEPKQAYIAYGITGYGQQDTIFRNNTVIATKQFTKSDGIVEGVSSPGLRIYGGAIAPGMSGGPVTDVFGRVVAIVNAGNSHESLLYDLADTMLCKG